ncbi:hypothetical protein ABFX02_03G015800 [Erythranthe guttata]
MFSLSLGKPPLCFPLLPPLSLSPSNQMTSKARPAAPLTCRPKAQPRRGREEILRRRQRRKPCSGAAVEGLGNWCCKLKSICCYYYFILFPFILHLQTNYVKPAKASKK